MARRSLRLTTRVTLFFGAIALLGGILLTVATFLFARNSLVNQRISTAKTVAIRHAGEVHEALAAGNTRIIETTMRNLDVDADDGYAVVLTEPRPWATRAARNVDAFSPLLVDTARGGESGQQIFIGPNDNPYLGIAIYLAAYDVGYLEAFPLESTERTLQVLATALVVGAVAAGVVATFFGWSVSRRLLRPISRVADAAGEIAHGGLGARLEPESDPDLGRLAGSFNEMADAVQERIERERRFASDVSHELRSPITALTAAVEVLDARRDDLPERTQQALDVVTSQIRRFDQMVIDLLELSRIDAGATDLNTEPVDLPELCERVSNRYGYSSLPIEVQRRARREAYVDRLRFERILSNLLENAATHGDGPTRISIEPAGGRNGVLMVVEDKGPGVAVSERTRIFERFARGSAARHRIGTGLGLALVAEHAAALGGTAWVEDRPGGGSRFIVRFPTEPSL
ncbi:MAG TPA: HAMP domain-containing sensor histidine kinase [Ilumatobacter sp.]|nr:HAMP domain-containing sensor histidine kinase [Ilumatobacter sp.]